MKKINLEHSTQTLASAGVIVGIVFLGVELVRGLEAPAYRSPDGSRLHGMEMDILNWRNLTR